ncbi:MAG: hypothetical protein SFY32_17510 [Bacteroidota bacterium]|nr:hypothetical protein [Bacteroidota bacterium]
MDFIKKSFWTTLASLAFACQSLITNKLFSVYFGPAGVTLLAHFQNIIALYTTVITDGVNRGVQRHLSDNNISSNYWNKYVSATIIINLLCYTVVTLGLFISFSLTSSGFPSALFTFNNIGLILISTILHLSAIFFVNMFLSEGNAKVYSILSIINNILGLVLVYFSSRFNLEFALIFISFVPASAIFIIAPTHLVIHRDKWKQFIFHFEISAIKQIFSFVIIALSGVIFGRFVDFFVRSYAIFHFTETETGLWQSVVKMSDGYSSVFIMAFGSLFFVRISANIHDHLKLQRTLIQGLVFISILSFIGLTMIWLLRSWLIPIFYNNNFMPAERFLPFQLIGDFIKFPSWLLSFLLLSRLKTKEYMIVHFLSALFYCASIYLLIPIFKIDSMPISHCIRFVFYLFMLIWLTRRDLFLR